MNSAEWKMSSDSYGENGWSAFIGVSKSLKDRGDFDHAEKLLKKSLSRAEEHMKQVEFAMSDILANLIEVYEQQGRVEEARELRLRLKELIKKQSRN